MPKSDLEIDLDLTDPRAGNRPTEPLLKDLDGDAQTVTVERAAKDDFLGHLRSTIDAARQVVEERLDSARPRRERAEEELDRALAAEREAFEAKWQRKAEWLRKRAQKAEEELPDLGGDDG